MLLVFLMLMMRRHELGRGESGTKIGGTAERICGAAWLEVPPKV